MSEFKDHAFKIERCDDPDGTIQFFARCSRCGLEAAGTMEELASGDYPECIKVAA